MTEALFDVQPYRIAPVSELRVGDWWTWTNWAHMGGEHWEQCDRSEPIGPKWRFEGPTGGGVADPGRRVAIYRGRPPRTEEVAS